MKVEKLYSVLPRDPSIVKLETIYGVHFTKREIDVIASLLSGKRAKKIALLLSVSHRTVEHHIENVKSKIGCSTQAGIIEFIEKAGKFLTLQRHYSNLLIEKSFESELKKISNLENKKNFNWLITCLKEQEDQILFKRLLADLKNSGVNVFFEYYKKDDLCFQEKIKHHDVDYVIHGLDTLLIERPQIERLAQFDKNSNAFTVFFIPTKKNDFSITHWNVMQGKPIGFQYFSIEKKGNYYLFFFEILKNILISVNVDEKVIRFKEQYADFFEMSRPEKKSDVSQLILEENSNKILKVFIKKQNVWMFINSIFFTIFLLISFLNVDLSWFVSSLLVILGGFIPGLMKLLLNFGQNKVI